MSGVPLPNLNVTSTPISSAASGPINTSFNNDFSPFSNKNDGKSDVEQMLIGAVVAVGVLLLWQNRGKI